MADDDGRSVSSRRQEGDGRSVRRSRSHRRRLSASSRSLHDEYNEQSSLLGGDDSGDRRAYSTVPATPRPPRLSRHHSAHSTMSNRPSRVPSFTQRLTRALSNYDLKGRSGESMLEDRVWYDQVGLGPSRACSGMQFTDSHGSSLLLPVGFAFTLRVMLYAHNRLRLDQ
jgi:chloride channel 3/4/5